MSHLLPLHQTLQRLSVSWLPVKSNAAVYSTCQALDIKLDQSSFGYLFTPLAWVRAGIIDIRGNYVVDNDPYTLSTRLSLYQSQGNKCSERSCKGDNTDKLSVQRIPTVCRVSVKVFVQSDSTGKTRGKIYMSPLILLLCGKASVLCNMTMPLWTRKKMFFSEFGAERDAQKWSGSGLESRTLQPGKWVKSWDIDVVTNIQRIFAGVPQMWLSNTCGNNMKQRQDTWHLNNKLYLPQMTSVRWINTKNKSFLHYNLLNKSFLQLHISSLFTPVMGRYGSLDISVRLLCGSCYSTLIIPMICSKLFNNHTGCVAFVCTYCCPCGQRVRCDFIHTAK